MERDRIDELKASAAALIGAYRDNYGQYQEAKYNETQLRIDFVNRLFALLGWDMDNARGLPQHLREVIHEATVSVEEDGRQRSKKPDYSFKAGTETKFFLETKKPSVNIGSDNAAAFQLRRYGWSGNLKISILTNFTDMYIYDCSVRPMEGDNAGTALIAHYHFEDYAGKFEEIHGLISKEAVMDGRFDRHFESIPEPFRREPFDRYFLEQIKNWRNMLGNDILGNNPGIDDETLNIFVQRILNRIIFLRICEDRNLERYESLRSVTTYAQLKELFLIADRKYDSGLFELLHEDSLTVSDETIIRIFQNLYYPESPYEFAVIEPYIIGQIYELFLDEALSIQRDGSIGILKKPEAVDCQGAVNTPKSIADIIVGETLGGLFENKTPDDAYSSRILDMCCGSGNFLLSAFEYMINFRIEHYLRNDFEGALKRGDIWQMPNGDCALSYESKRAILESNIFGVDIDPLAVEVAKFSLLVKSLERSSPDELDAYHRRTRNRILPNLDGNIKVGNSLVDASYARFNDGIFESIGLMGKIRMFDWDAEFGGGKFDAIIGNPPYIRVQNMARYSQEEYDYYKSGFSKYSTSAEDAVDKYHLFIEKGFSLLKENGMLGYIVPHKFMNIQSGRKLRELLTEGRNVKKIIHFGVHQVFRDRSTYTCILLLSRMPNEKFEIGFVEDLGKFLHGRDAECMAYPADYIGRKPWVFLPRGIQSHLAEISPKCAPLSSLADIFVGVQTSADQVYVIHADHEDGSFVHSHDIEGREFRIERGILRKSIYDARLAAYERIASNSYIIFPYKDVDGKPTLHSLDEMAESFPCALEYLGRFRERLERRNMIPECGDGNWFAYGRGQSLKRFVRGERLVWPVLSTGANYVYDDLPVVFTGGGNGPFYGLELKESTRESIFYIQAILNHWLMELIVKSKSSRFRGEYYSHGKQFLENLPIRKIDFSDREEASCHRHIVDSVKKMMDMKEKASNAGTAAKKTMIERSISVLKKDMNDTIDALYRIEPMESERANEAD